MDARVAIVVVNYRTAGLVVDCLHSLAPEIAAHPGTRVVVVDNASGDGSVGVLDAAIAREGWSAWATTLPLATNGGFSAGNNAGMQAALAAPDPPGWFWLLNPDTVVRPGALRALVDRGEADLRIGIVGSRLEDPDGTPQVSTFRFHSAASQLDEAASLGPLSRLLGRSAVVIPVPDGTRDVPWVSGASMLVRRRMIEQVGSLDDGYFLYYEEVDLCLRAARAGWRCVYEPRSRVVHLVGKATGVDPAAAVRRLPAYVLESRRRYFVKNHGRAYAALADAAWLAGHLSWRLRMRLQGRPERAAPGVLSDFLRHSALAPGRPAPRGGSPA